MTDFENIKDFRIRDNKGNKTQYKRGDVVRKNGKTFVALKNTQGYSPEHGEKGGWKEINKSRNTKFSINSTAPEIANEGDEWYDTANGLFLKYIINETNGNSQWVEM